MFESYRYFLGLGGNQGKVAETFNEAAKLLAEKFGPVKASSSLYLSQALKLEQSKEQDDYLNCILVFDTKITPQQALLEINQIEKKLGRLRAEKWGPRNIDIDIVAIGEEVFSSNELQVPHPEMHNRSFVLMPLAEVDRNWHHPVFKKTANELFANLPNPTPCKILSSFLHCECE